MCYRKKRPDELGKRLRRLCAHTPSPVSVFCRCMIGFSLFFMLCQRKIMGTAKEKSPGPWASGYSCGDWLIKFIDGWRPIGILGGTIPGQGILNWIYGRKQASRAVGHIYSCLLTVHQCGHLLQALAALTSLPSWTLPWTMSWNKCLLPWVAFFRVFQHSNKVKKLRQVRFNALQLKYFFLDSLKITSHGSMRNCQVQLHPIHWRVFYRGGMRRKQEISPLLKKY